MYGFLSRLIISKRLQFEQGKIIFVGQPMSFLSLLTLKEMTLDAMKEGKRGINRLYYYGWHSGYTFTKAYMETLKLRPFEETFKLIMDVSSMIGYGDYQTLEFKQRKYSKFKNIENPFGLLFYPSDKMYCHFIRGINAGGGTALHGVLMNGLEFECTAQNGKYCLFMNIENSIIKKKYSDIAKEQLDMEWLKKKQLELIKRCGEDPKKYLKEESKKVKDKE
ncbi:MAG: hypothetical protein DRP11_00380 [Candidatus Aenigmatarchaeota archaeon]|nr:MAG: hypothetical protein DRP11_00380 [Candidatus Aenigmarchaeota archaeon]